MPEVKFKYPADDLGVPKNGNHYLVEWTEQRIVFSFARKGNAITMHFASDKNGIRHIRKAVADFIDFIFFMYPWCKMILALIIQKNIMRLAERVGFIYESRTASAVMYSYKRC